MRSLVFVLLLTILQYSVQDDALKVSVYYESLCPDSIRFITQQLYPSYPKIGSSLDLHFVPYGKATQVQEGDKWQFQCQHGPNECWGNKAQACGISVSENQDATLEFVNCVMSQPYPANEDAINLCAPKVNATGQALIECSETREADELLAKYGDETHGVTPKITFVPTIVFNDKFDQATQDNSLRKFLETACEALGNKPEGCK